MARAASQSSPSTKKPRSRKRRTVLRRLIAAFLAVVVSLFTFFLVTLLLMRWIDPPFTAVQVSRRVAAAWSGARYERRYEPKALNRISANLQHAVIAAEDGRFYGHSGIDFEELRKVVEDDIDEGRVGRGASTITQQLVKNLYLTTRRSYFRKGLEFVLAPVAELVLGKQRILELYLNVIEWGPGVFGAEAAAKYHYGVGAAMLSREQAARLAAVIPSPLRRKPARMNEYSLQIQTRMRQMGW